MDSQEEKIERLERQVKFLKTALARIDKQVDRAAGKYLRSPVPQGLIEFGEFLDLLVLEVRRECREEYRRQKKTLDTIPRQVLSRLEGMLEEKVLELLPRLQGKLSDYVTIKILIQPKRSPPILFQRHGADAPYTAMSLRGAVKQALGETPLEAYRNLRERLMLELFKLDPNKLAQRLLSETPGVGERFALGQPFMTESVDGFTFVSRFLDHPEN